MKDLKDDLSTIGGMYLLVGALVVLLFLFSGPIFEGFSIGVSEPPPSIP